MTVAHSGTRGMRWGIRKPETLRQRQFRAAYYARLNSRKKAGAVSVAKTLDDSGSVSVNKLKPSERSKKAVEQALEEQVSVEVLTRSPNRRIDSEAYE